ncbi:MAG: glucose 1-dehydrogenase [Clostridia bacterium]|nr:glucose 1-dehydrogenase [Clostridia bacterium]
MKTALITGGSRGIGKEICSLFAQNGFLVVSTYNKTKPEEIENVTYIKCDISKEANTLFEKAENILGHIDVIINNAGVSHIGVIQDFSENDYNAVFDTNLKSTFILCSKAADHMVKNKSGCIINISSIWGISGASCESLYSASKGAVINLTKSLAKELGPSNIRVNAIAPGVIKTDMLNCYADEELEELRLSTPLERLGSPSDVAKLALFLASNDASFITGQTITVDGGFTL